MNVIEITAEKKTAQETIRLAAYCRVSSDSEDQLHSFAAQIRYYKDYERRHPQYKLVDIYADEGITGTCMDKRDDLHRLIRDCKKGLIDRIIVKSVSRFARNTQELLATIRFLKDIGVSVYFEEQGIDTDKLNSEMIVTFPGMAAQQESESISGNMRWSYKKRMESGDFNCCAPAYGFDLVDGSLVINETEAVIVQRIFSMYLQGYGKQAIANKLNEESVPKRHGTKLPFGYKFEDGKIVINPDEQNTLQRICSEYLDGRSLLQIANGLESDKVEFAPGVITWNKARIMRIVDDDRYLGTATYPQVIDEATVKRLRSRKASRNTQTSTDRQSGIYLLKVPVVCPACGKPMRRLQDTRCKCTQKWVCNQCHIQIKKEDTELMEDIVDLLNGLIRNPAIIRSALPGQAEPSAEQRRLDNEIARTLEGYDFDKDALREKLYQRAAIGYQQIGNEAYVEYKLKNALEQHDILDGFDSELTNKTIKVIRLAESGSVSIILINDQEIRKEQTDHASSSPSDAT